MRRVAKEGKIWGTLEDLDSVKQNIIHGILGWTLGESVSPVFYVFPDEDGLVLFDHEIKPIIRIDVTVMKGWTSEVVDEK